jgi:hypothetical protein
MFEIVRESVPSTTHPAFSGRFSGRGRLRYLPLASTMTFSSSTFLTVPTQGSSTHNSRGACSSEPCSGDMNTTSPDLKSGLCTPSTVATAPFRSSRKSVEPSSLTKVTRATCRASPTRTRPRLLRHRLAWHVLRRTHPGGVDDQPVTALEGRTHGACACRSAIWLTTTPDNNRDARQPMATRPSKVQPGPCRSSAPPWGCVSALRRGPRMRLGVKGSQVQILSSRQGFIPLSQVRGRFLVSEEAAFGALRDLSLTFVSRFSRFDG